MDGTGGSASDASSVPFLRVVKGDATPEEIAALTVVLQGLAASATPPSRKPRSEWSAHHRKTVPAFFAGPGGWRSSGMPR